jgi:predicted transcriptional regulator
MARTKTPTLTEAEYRLMDILWTNGALSVAGVVDRIGDPPLAYNTVLTTLRILEQKGYLSHKASGRAFIYKASVERDEAQTTLVNHMVSRFFGGSPRDLVLNLLDSESLDAAELERLRELIERKAAPA